MGKQMKEGRKEGRRRKIEESASQKKDTHLPNELQTPMI
jgi:hypothetical protein